MGPGRSEEDPPGAAGEIHTLFLGPSAQQGNVHHQNLGPPPREQIQVGGEVPGLGSVTSFKKRHARGPGDGPCCSDGGKQAQELRAQPGKPAGMAVPLSPGGVRNPRYKSRKLNRVQGLGALLKPLILIPGLLKRPPHPAVRKEENCFTGFALPEAQRRDLTWWEVNS